jgi:hypothetical protein
MEVRNAGHVRRGGWRSDGVAPTQYDKLLRIRTEKPQLFGHEF